MSDRNYRGRPGRGAPRRPSPAARGIVRVDPDFADEFPDGDATSTQACASLVRTGTALLAEIDRCLRAALDIPQTASSALAVIDGAGGPLTPSQISERILAASATMTSTLDLLENRGWIIRTPNLQDRRSVLVEITAEGRTTADRILAGIRAIEVATMSGLALTEREQLLDLLAKVLTATAAVVTDPPTPMKGRRNRPTRLDQQPQQRASEDSR